MGYEWHANTTYIAVIRARNPRVSDMTQRYTELVVPPFANRLADIERREQRVAVHWNKMSTTSSSCGPGARTSAKQEIETDVNESVR